MDMTYLENEIEVLRYGPITSLQHAEDLVLQAATCGADFICATNDEAEEGQPAIYAALNIGGKPALYMGTMASFDAYVAKAMGIEL